MESQVIEGPCVVEFPVLQWSQNCLGHFQDKENVLPKRSRMPLKMLEKEEYLETVAEKMPMDQVIDQSKELWRNRSNDQLKFKRPASQGGLSGRTTKRSSRTSLKQQLISNLNLNTMMQ